MASLLKRLRGIVSSDGLDVSSCWLGYGNVPVWAGLGAGTRALQITRCFDLQVVIESRILQVDFGTSWSKYVSNFGVDFSSQGHGHQQFSTGRHLHICEGDNEEMRESIDVATVLAWEWANSLGCFFLGCFFVPLF